MLPTPLVHSTTAHPVSALLPAHFPMLIQVEAERSEAERRLSSLDQELSRQRERSEASALALTAAEKLLEQAQAQSVYSYLLS